MSLVRELLDRAELVGFEGAVRAYSRAVRMLPDAAPRRYGVEVVADVPYVDDGTDDHMLDVYARPTARPQAPLLYVHGGGFARFSRQVYWIAALALARRGFTVFLMDHRRAPAHRYPAAHEDVALAALWVREHAPRFGADPARLVLAGDSTGANPVTALAIACAYRSAEPWAREVHAARLSVRAVAAACGFLEVADTSRYQTRAELAPWIKSSIAAVGRDYCAPDQPRASLVDPLVVVEHGAPPERPLPPFFIGAGDRDPLADDSTRLAAALHRLGVPVDAKVYAGGVHGFHYLFPCQRRSIRCWSDQARFLRRHTAVS